MTEIEKLYKNAGIKPIHYDACKIADAYWANEELANEYGTFDNYMKLNCPYKYEECTDNCRHAFDRDTYPPFTAEKQIELIKWLCRTGRCVLRVVQYTDTNNWCIQTVDYISCIAESFENAIAGLINNLWQDLTEEEQQQIKEILQ